MALRKLPHSVSIWPMVETIAADKSTTVAWPSASVQGMPCMILPKSFTTAYNEAGVEIVRPHKLLCDLTYLPDLQVGARIVYGSRIFKVATQPENHNAGNAADYASVMLEELDLG